MQRDMEVRVRDFKASEGPFDMIGDVHGCFAELRRLLNELGYVGEGAALRHPKGRIPVFVGDLADRGPEPMKVVRWVAALAERGRAIWVMGNHDEKGLLRKIVYDRRVQVNHGLDITLDDYAALPAAERRALRRQLRRLHAAGRIYPYVILDHGRLVVSHAGIREWMIGRWSKTIRAFCLYGDVDQEALRQGILIRRDWAQQYEGEPFVVYGHTVVEEPRRVRNTINIDTGCVFGGALTAYRYPEETTHSVPAAQAYAHREVSGSPAPVQAGSTSHTLERGR